VISGPSGVGKDALISRLVQLDGYLRQSVSYTTRPPRKNEVDGVDYSFVTREQFQKLIDDGALLEHAMYHGNLYGTSRARVEVGRASGHDVIMKIEVKGAEQVRQRVPDGLFIFIAPPSMEELAKRQEKRKSESPSEMAARRRIAEGEMAHAGSYDRVVVNDDLDRAVAELLEIIRAARERHT
jgi:guanylate kinase